MSGSVQKTNFSPVIHDLETQIHLLETSKKSLARRWDYKSKSLGRVLLNVVHIISQILFGNRGPGLESVKKQIKTLKIEIKKGFDANTLDEESVIKNIDRIIAVCERLKEKYISKNDKNYNFINTASDDLELLKEAIKQVPKSPKLSTPPNEEPIVEPTDSEYSETEPLIAPGQTDSTAFSDIDDKVDKDKPSDNVGHTSDEVPVSLAQKTARLPTFNKTKAKEKARQRELQRKRQAQHELPLRHVKEMIEEAEVDFQAVQDEAIAKAKAAAEAAAKAATKAKTKEKASTGKQPKKAKERPVAPINPILSTSAVPPAKVIELPPQKNLNITPIDIVSIPPEPPKVSPRTQLAEVFILPASIEKEKKQVTLQLTQVIKQVLKLDTELTEGKTRTSKADLLVAEDYEDFQVILKRDYMKLFNSKLLESYEEIEPIFKRVSEVLSEDDKEDLDAHIKALQVSIDSFKKLDLQSKQTLMQDFTKFCEVVLPFLNDTTKTTLTALQMEVKEGGNNKVLFKVVNQGKELVDNALNEQKVEFADEATIDKIDHYFACLQQGLENL